MVFSSNATKKSIIERSYFYAFGDSLDHSTAWPLADVTASSNENVQDTALLIWRSSNTWKWDDLNQTDLPFGTTTLETDSQDYTLPNTVFEVLGVYVLRNDGETWKRLNQRNPDSEGGISFMSSNLEPGLPEEYDIVGNSVILDRFPTSAACTLTNGLKVIVSREATTFTTPATYTTSDTTQPGFDEGFHVRIPIKNAYHWCLANGNTEKCAGLLQELNRIDAAIVSHYGRKNADNKVGIRPRMNSYF